MGRQGCKTIILLLTTLLAACVKDTPNPSINIASTNGSVYVVCEGNFGNGDATLYNYNTATDSVNGDLYRTHNNAALGDVFQSMKRIGDSLYLCINNSDKVVVLNAKTHKEAGIINIPKPRYILPISPSLAYVSTLYSNKIYTINPKTLQVTGTITIPHQNPEGMVRILDNVIVCPWDTTCNKIYTINTTNSSVTHTTQIAGYAPHAVLVDKEQMLWVMAGNATKGKAATLTRIDPSTGNILKAYTYASGVDPIKPAFNKTRDTLYYIQVKYDGSTDGNGIYRMSILGNELPTVSLIPTLPYQYYYALGIEPATGYLYVGDPKGFTQKGTVGIYKQDGNLLKTFTTGLGPGQIYFGE